MENERGFIGIKKYFGCQKLSRTGTDPEMGKGRRLRKMSMSKGQIQARRKMKDVVTRNINVQLVSIATATREPNLIIRIASGSSRGSTSAKTMPEIQGRVADMGSSKLGMNWAAVSGWIE